MAGLVYVVYLVSASSKGVRLIGFGTRLGSFSQWCQIAACALPKIHHWWAPQGHFTTYNCCYQDDNATPYRARVALDFLQQGNVTKMDQPEKLPDCNLIEYISDELGHAITSMDNPP